jgi:hypothetical protein
MMPKEAIRWLRHTAGRWEEAGEVPIVMTESRQVNLEKPGKALNGVLKTKDTRPINVFSVL